MGFLFICDLKIQTRLKKNDALLQQFVIWQYNIQFEDFLKVNIRAGTMSSKRIVLNANILNKRSLN